MSTDMATEQLTIELPDGFDPARHVKALTNLIATEHGEGWEIDHIDPQAGTALATRQAAITEVSDKVGPQPRTSDDAARS